MNFESILFLIVGLVGLAIYAVLAIHVCKQYDDYVKRDV